MIDVHEQDQIDAGGRQFRVGQGAQDRLDVFYLLLGLALVDEIQHFLLNVHGEELALVADALGNAKGVVAAAGAHVGNHVAGFEFQRIQQFRAVFLFLALGTFEPAGGLEAHHLGDLTAHVEFADAVRIVLAARFVARFLFGFWRFG